MNEENVLRSLERLPGDTLCPLYDSCESATSSREEAWEAGSRRLLFRGGDICLELHLQLHPDPEKLVVEGHLSRLCDPLRSIRSAPVVLLCEGPPTTVVWSDRHGTFRLLVARAPSTWLWIGTSTRRLELSLDSWLLPLP